MAKLRSTGNQCQHTGWSLDCTLHIPMKKKIGEYSSWEYNLTCTKDKMQWKGVVSTGLSLSKTWKNLLSAGCYVSMATSLFPVMDELGIRNMHRTNGSGMSEEWKGNFNFVKCIL